MTLRKKSGGVFRRLFFLLLVAGGGWILYTRIWPKHDLQHFGGQLEKAIDQELTQAGVTDRNVLSQTRKEHTLGFLRWVETERTLQLPDDKRARKLSQGLEQVARRFGCTLKKESSSESITLEIKRYFWVLQRLRLRVAPALITSEIPKVPKGPRVAFVIDDVAYEVASMDRFASLGVPLTFAILPRDRHSKELAQKANAMNFPVMLHLPMEPLDMVHNDPGPAGLYLRMSDAELKSQFDKNVASIPYLVGINNHMGSAFTESVPKMTLVLEWVKKRGLYFLDSRTSGHSVVCKVAKRLDVPCLANETFLDNKDDVKSIEDQLDVVLRLALKEGQTIAIGHYRRKYLVQALADKLPEFKARGVQVVALPAFYHR